MTSGSELKNNENQCFTKTLLMSIIHKYSGNMLDFKKKKKVKKKLRIHKKDLCSEVSSKDQKNLKLLAQELLVLSLF